MQSLVKETNRWVDRIQQGVVFCHSPDSITLLWIQTVLQNQLKDTQRSFRLWPWRRLLGGAPTTAAADRKPERVGERVL